MQLSEFLDTLRNKTGKAPQKSGGGYLSCCPAHKDANPSLSFKEDCGKILLHCFAGCTTENICQSLNLQISDLFTIPLQKQEHFKKIVYSYRNIDGHKLYQKIRIEPGYNGKPKSFYWERKGENGEVVRNLNDCKKVLYRLPELLKAISEQKTIYLVEGEKDVERLFLEGLIATTSPESATWLDDFTLTLREADVILLYDMDKAGLERKNHLSQKLYGKVKRLRVLDLPGLECSESHGKDVSDWLAEGHTITEFLTLSSQAPDYSLPAKPLLKEKIRAVNLKEFLDMDLPKREMLLSPFLPSQGLAMIYAKRGVGKTHVALGIACAIANGGKFLKWTAPSARKVLFIDGEMPGPSIQERLRRIVVSDILSIETHRATAFFFSYSLNCISRIL